MNDTDYMSMALKLAEKGRAGVSPNPMAGAVIVKEGRIIGQGCHLFFGGPHAERNALASLTESPRGATLYVTLEPCCHHGKTPPCTDAIVKSGIRRVVIGTKDPNPMVSGTGAEILISHGIEVTEGVLEEACREINHVFFHYIKTGRPFVVMKYAMTLDGKTATCAGHSRWITGERSRRRVHEDRNRYSAVMCGVGTILADDSLLTCRLPDTRNPVRIICDSRLRTPPDSQVAATCSQARTILATCCADRKAWLPYEEKGCEILLLPSREGHTDLNALTEHLGRMGIDSILLEGGASLSWSALSQGIVNRVQAYISPKLFGGASAKTPVGGSGVQFPYQGFTLGKTRITALDEDILIEGEVRPCSQES